MFPWESAFTGKFILFAVFIFLFALLACSNRCPPFSLSFLLSLSLSCLFLGVQVLSVVAPGLQRLSLPFLSLTLTFCPSPSPSFTHSLFTLILCSLSILAQGTLGSIRAAHLWRYILCCPTVLASHRSQFSFFVFCLLSFYPWL